MPNKVSFVNSKSILTKQFIMPWRFVILLYFAFSTLYPLGVLSMMTSIMFRVVHGEKVMVGTDVNHRLYLHDCVFLCLSS